MRFRANTPRTETGKNRGLRGQRQVILISRLPVAINLRLGPRKPPSIADKTLTTIAKPSRFARLFAITRNWHPVSACNNGVKRQAKAENPSKGGWCYDCWV